jgi:mannosyl-oligosaccharide alpha-1,2-mannosidase
MDPVSIVNYFYSMAPLTLTQSKHAPFFETVIRYLGGLLSAYALSNEPILLSRADELAHKLLPAFRTPTGLPRFSVNPETYDIRQYCYASCSCALYSRGESKDADDRVGTAVLAEVGTYQMEYKFLAHLTGRKEYHDKVRS